MTSAEFQTLASTLRPRLLAQATRYLRDTAEAEDIVQDAMLKMWVLHDQLIGNAEAFASVLVRNLSLNRLRQLHRMQTLTEMDLLEMERLDADSRSQQDTDEQVAQLRALSDSTADVSFAVGSKFCSGEYDIIKVMVDADGAMYKDKQEYYKQQPDKDRRRRGR